MTTNDIKKGMRVLLYNGWEARIEDNKKGNIRFATVFGDYTEMGSIYAHDIESVEVNGEWVDINHTTKQKNTSNMLSALFG